VGLKVTRLHQLEVEAGKVREFARATRSDNPAYHEADAVVPATFLTRFTWAEGTPKPTADLGFEPSRMLHAAEAYTFTQRVPRAGERLEVSSEVVERYEKSGSRGGSMRFAVVLNRFFDAAGDLVAEQRSTFVEIAPPGDDGRRVDS
jgi:hypothetical protein